MNGYTLVATDETGMLAEVWAERKIDETEIIEYCRSEGYDGVVVYAGMHYAWPFPVDGDYAEITCGRIDAR